MAKYSATRTETKRVEIELPDDIDAEIWGWHDPTLRAKVANKILQENYRSIERQRDELQSEDASRVDDAVRNLTRAFAKADEIIKMVREN